jgi:phosphopentomutase
MGLAAAVRLASGAAMPGMDAEPAGLWGAATEISRGKDTPSGHWELLGVPVPWEWHHFPRTDPAFPQALLDRISDLAGADGTLANAHASGVPVIEALGAEHLRTGRPIVYTSADSVVQIAAHEEAFGLERLLGVCRALAPEVHAMRVGRVIARPFTGAPGAFERTGNRRDFAIAPPSPTLLDAAMAEGRETWGLGKIGDIFSGRGIEREAHGTDAALLEETARLVREAPDGALVVANLVEFDALYGHRRDVAGYAAALERLDAALPSVTGALREGDLLVLSADHGNDPTWEGSDHTRERVPVLVVPGRGSLGLVGFSDVGASVAGHLGLRWRGAGRSFLGAEVAA